MFTSICQETSIPFYIKKTGLDKAELSGTNLIVFVAQSSWKCCNNSWPVKNKQSAVCQGFSGFALC